MADNMDKNMDKEAQKAAREAKKAEEKARQERIKASKPKKEGNVFTRAGDGIKKFVKDFKGVAKKVTWPDSKTVLKNSGIVLAVVAIFGIAVYGIDQVLNLAFSGASDLAIRAGEYFAEDIEEVVVTDENGETVTDENGEAVTQIVTTTEAVVEEATEEAAEEAAEEATEEAAEEATEETTIEEETVSE